MDGDRDINSLNRSREGSRIVWPNALGQGLVLSSILKEQIKLVRLASELGLYHSRVQRLQVELIKSLQFRIGAVIELSRKLRSVFLGNDVNTFNTYSNSFSKIEIVE